jgi:very-short-patch-repair endonuclease
MARTPKKIQLARTLRKDFVPAEALLWKALRNRALGGFKFRRQHPIGRYVADFACVESKIAVEVDGETHLPRKDADQKRTEAMQADGWCVMRFWNNEIYDELDPVKEAIYQLCLRRSNPPSPRCPSPPAAEPFDGS